MYSKIFQLHAEMLKAMSHPRRLEIIQLLRQQQLTVSEIHLMLDLPQANVSQHLRILREAKIVQAEKNGKQVYYSLAHPNFIKACDLVREILIEANQDSSFLKQLKFPMNELVPLVHDPVCQMRVSPKTAGYHTIHQGEHYYFCASGCIKQFQKNPDQYVSK